MQTALHRPKPALPWPAAVSFVLLAVWLPSGAAGRPPNIVFVLADDLGWSELGCYGNRFNETPHLDRLAAAGVRFTQAYAAAPVCSPYRASLMTGQYPARHGVLDYLRPDSGRPLPTSHLTLAEMLQRNGYATGVIGKWHLTGYKHHGAEFEVRATSHGFDEEIAAPVKGVGNGANFWPYVFRTQPIRWLNLDNHRLGDDEYLVDRMNLEATDFIRRHKDEPFFLYLSHYAPHTILNGRPDLVEKYRRKHPPGKSTREKCYLCQDAGRRGDPLNHWAGNHNPHLAAMLESIDTGVGQIIETLRELKLERDTILIFSSDNGGETNVTSNAPLRGGKSQLYEGGIRVPLIVRWPQQFAAGKTSDLPTVNVDFYPTLLEASGAKPDPAQTLDGESILDELVSPGEQPAERPLYWHYPLDRPHFLGGVSGGAVRSGRWKLIEKFKDQPGERAKVAHVELYDLAADPGEQRDLTREHPQVAIRLQIQLAAWRESIGARLPPPPLLSEPGKLHFEDAFDGPASDRWFFQKQWNVADGHLIRNQLSLTKNQRIFLRKPQYRDVLIRFDFRFDGAEEIRLMTGTPGKYNAVIQIYPDRFEVHTATDGKRARYPTMQGECACRLAPGEWHTMTVEIVGDEIVARTGPRHFVIGQHPILDQQRTYFAFQVDRPAAAFDNVEILHAKRRGNWTPLRSRLAEIQRARPAIARSPQDELKILRSNTRDRLDRTDERFRQLVVAAVERQKQQQSERYPDVFRTIKQVRGEIDEYRRGLLKSDQRYKSLRDQIYRARRAETDFILGEAPQLKQLPKSRYEAELERQRQRLSDHEQLKQLSFATLTLERQMQADYPRLFLTNEQILAAQRAARAKHNHEAPFQALLRQTADAVRAEREYVETAEPRIAELEAKVKAASP